MNQTTAPRIASPSAMPLSQYDAGTLSKAAIMTLPEYITALKSHDWFYEQSDDHSVWTRGKKAAQLLRQAQQSLDPLGSLWNASAPKECRIFAS